MCARCTPETPATAPTPTAPVAPRARFAALRHRPLRGYLAGTMLSMMADNVEHVITYLVVWQTFHSPALTGFTVISHWTPHLLLSVWCGQLADRHDCRRVVQVAQGLFMTASAAWGLLFATGSLTMGWTVVLLVVHGMASAVWGPAEQLLLHDIVGPEDLPSAVRLSSTARSLGVLAGPVVGAGLLAALGTTGGILANIAFYLPLTLWMARTPYTGHLRDGAAARASQGLRGALRTLREVRDDRELVGLVALAAAASLLGGVVVGSAMPTFADDLGQGASEAGYGALLVASGAGGVLAGLLLEATGRAPRTAAAAFGATAVAAACTATFALTGSYPVALAALLVAGVGNLVSSATGMTLVQLRAPAGRRGQVVGLYGVGANGFKAGSGVLYGALATAVGPHLTLGADSVVLCAAAAGLGALVLRRPPAPVRRQH